MNALTLQAGQAILEEATVSALLQSLRERVGITIETPRWLIEEYLQERIVDLGLGNLGAYMAYLNAGLESRAEWLALVDLLTVKETRFFRQPEAFALVHNHLASAMAEAKTWPELAIWSVGCSTGEELYSLGMVVDKALRDAGSDTNWHGIGTDVSFGAIARARSGVYPTRNLVNIPLPYRHTGIEPSSDGQALVAEAIRSRVNFFHSNLMHVSSAPFAKFDVVFCQNVLIYFDRDTRLQIIDELFARTRNAGLMVLGAGEDIGWHRPEAERVSQRGITAFKKTEV